MRLAKRVFMRLGGDSGQRIPGIDREVVFFRFFDSTKMGELSFIPQGTVGGIRFSWVLMIEIGVFLAWAWCFTSLTQSQYDLFTYAIA